MALALCWLVFGLIYQRHHFGVTINKPFQKSFDITFLIGYGNQVTENLNLSSVQNLQAVISIVVYTVLFATVVSKLSRAR